MKILTEILWWDRTRSGIRRKFLATTAVRDRICGFLVLAALSYRSKLAKSVLDYFINN